jgi:hypothetical protein
MLLMLLVLFVQKRLYFLPERLKTTIIAPIFVKMFSR